MLMYLSFENVRKGSNENRENQMFCETSTEHLVLTIF